MTATLRLVDDVTANPDLIRLLTGPRWRIGPRDLALLGRRARELARAAPERGERAPDEESTPHVSARRAGAGRRRRRPNRGGQPARCAGETRATRPYSPAARERFARLAAELADSCGGTARSRCST